MKANLWYLHQNIFPTRTVSIHFFHPSLCSLFLNENISLPFQNSEMIFKRNLTNAGNYYHKYLDIVFKLKITEVAVFLRIIPGTFPNKVTAVLV